MRFHHSHSDIWKTVQALSSIYCFRKSSFSLLLFLVERILGLEQVVLLDKDRNDKTTHCFQHSFAMSTKTNCIEAINLFQKSCCVEALNSTTRPQSLKVRHDHIFETSKFVLTSIESLQNCIKIESCLESCRHRLTRRVRVKLARIYSNNQFANICGLAEVSLVSNSFTCKHY